MPLVRLKSISTSYRSRIQCKNEKPLKSEHFQVDLLFCQMRIWFHITQGTGNIFSFIPQNLPFVTFPCVNFILHPQVYLGNQGTITRRQRNNFIK